MSVEKGSDDLWVAEKFQSNPEIAGSPRNIFRDGLVVYIRGGRALTGLGTLPGYRTLSNSECCVKIHGSQAVTDKCHGREGNSPDRRLRSQIVVKWKRM